MSSRNITSSEIYLFKVAEKEFKNLEFITGIKQAEGNKFHKEYWVLLIILFLAFYVLVFGMCKAHGLFQRIEYLIYGCGQTSQELWSSLMNGSCLISI